MTTLSDADLRVLKALANQANYREDRCPYCMTFHRKDCGFHERLCAVLDKLAPGWREVVKQ